MDVRSRVRNNVAVTTAALATVSLALIFAAALRAVPADAVPHAPEAVVAAIPHVNAAISLAALACIVAGVHAIRGGHVRRHRALMLTAFALFVAFLVLYLYRVALEGPTPFGGPGIVYRALYLPLLAVHVSLAVICMPLLYFVLLLAWSRPIDAIPATGHAPVGRVAATLWATSFVLGLVVYALLYVVY